MKVRLELLSDAIFGSGMSIPGAEDIGIQTDRDGFPYFKGSTMKGILREEAENYANWTGLSALWISTRFGEGGIDFEDNENVIRVTDFKLPVEVRQAILNEHIDPQDALTSLRTFTQLEDGIAKETSLRVARCINKGLVFYGEIDCCQKDLSIFKDILQCTAWIGSMRTRGFGHISLMNVE